MIVFSSPCNSWLQTQNSRAVVIGSIWHMRAHYSDLTTTNNAAFQQAAVTETKGLLL